MGKNLIPKIAHMLGVELGEEAAMKELMGMMTEAAQQYCEETKKGAEKHELN